MTVEQFNKRTRNKKE
jgi:cytochrome b involved in lipid metabolism